MFSRKRLPVVAGAGVAKKGTDRKDRKDRAIIGEVQSGKTKAMIVSIGNSANLCIVVVRNVGPDVRQFLTACKRASIPAVTFSSDSSIRSLSCGVLVKPKVIVLLANACNVKKARAEMRAAGSPPFDLYIDEADKLAFSTEPSDRSFRAELERLQVRLVAVRCHSSRSFRTSC